MKNKIINCYTVLFILLLAVQDASAQTCTGAAPFVKDLIALPTTNNLAVPPCPVTNLVNTSTNTGTDIYNDGNNDYQVMVWDGSQASLSWNCAGTKGSFTFNSLNLTTGASTLNDPDVVIMKIGSTIYTMFVAEVPTGIHAGKIFWASLQWTGATFGSMVSGFVGDVATNGVCSNPNIDVNSCGRVAIVWAQAKVYTLTITTSGPGDYTFGPIATQVYRSDIYAAQGFIDGKSCTGGGVISGYSIALGDRASYPSGVAKLFEKNIYPDVCLSDASTSCGSGIFIMTVGYTNQYFDPQLFKIETQVKAVQFQGTACIDLKLGVHAVYALTCPYPGRPRLASRPGSGTKGEDFQMVMADPSKYCNVGGPPCNPYSTKIYHWGKHNNVAPSATATILNTTAIGFCDFSGVYNNDVAIAYRSDLFQPAGDFVVAWTTNNPGTGTFIAGTVGNDVIARTYNMGYANLLAPGTTQYSIVNGGCNGQAGNQSLASIAGRYTKNVGYMFWDNASTTGKPYMGYKTSDNRPGITPILRQTANIDAMKTDFALDTEVFTAQPNPFTDEISFKINLKEGNKASQIEITDATGRLVKTLPVSENMKSISWRPVAGTGNGIYYAKLLTTQGTISTQIVKAQ